MARYQLRMHGWPIFDHFIPQGTIIDDVNGTDDFSKLVRARGLSPPLNAQPLDQSTYDAMVALYGGNNKFLAPDQTDLRRWIITTDGIVR